MNDAIWSESQRAPDFDLFIPQHPRVGGFAGRERARQSRYLRPVHDQFTRPLPLRLRLSVEYEFVFVGSEYDLSNGNRIIKTDVDNLLKFVNDLLNGVVWEDDSQIFEMRATKQTGPESGIGIRIWVMNDDLDPEAR